MELYNPKARHDSIDIKAESHWDSKDIPREALPDVNAGLRRKLNFIRDQWVTTHLDDPKNANDVFGLAFSRLDSIEEKTALEVVWHHAVQPKISRNVCSK